MNSNLQEKLGLQCPIVQAPMAGGPTTPRLVASVAAAGALGSFGLAYSTPEQIHSQCRDFQNECADRRLNPDCGWNANFFVFPEVVEPDLERLDRAKKQLESLGRRVAIDAQAMQHETQLPDLREQITAALAYQPSVVSLHLGIPPDEIIALIHAAGCYVALSATSLDEGLRVQEAGADFIVAQGIEAGGHRGIFDPDASDDKLGVADLVAQLVTRCDLPVIASGGIMNGADIAKLRIAGADAVQMGSAFLTVDECGSCDTYRAAIDKIGDRDTQLTCGFSGRPARGIRNLFIDATVSNEAVLKFPIQNSLTASMRKAAAGMDDFELMSLWAGANYRQARYCSAAQLLRELQKEMLVALEKA